MAGNASSEEGVYRTSGGYEVPWRARRRSGTKAPGLRVSPRQGVVVTLPLGSRLDPRDVLRRYDTWLERAVRRTAGQRQAYLQSQEAPEAVTFPVSDETWRVDYHETASSRIQVRLDANLGLVRLSGAVTQDQLVRKALQRFVKLRAEDVLPELLRLVSRDAGIPYTSCRVSSARSRWGSCSTTGAIMLSDRLMFLPQHLAVHVCLHELSHIPHPDHQSGFHALLGRLDPEADEHAAQLKVAMALVPGWMDPE